MKIAPETPKTFFMMLLLSLLTDSIFLC
jgi:hypothetical protein